MRALRWIPLLLVAGCGADPATDASVSSTGASASTSSATAATSSSSGGPMAMPSTPTIGACWTIASVPDLGPAFNAPGQQPVDFAIWPAADGTWQLWSCIRATKEEGNTRLFHRWEGAKITDANWTPKGIAMRAGRVTPNGAPNDGGFDASFGEAMGGLQAPFVFEDGASYRMVYGTWGNLGEQTSADGKTFTRLGRQGNDVRLFATTGAKRDPMLLVQGGEQLLFFTDNPGGQGGDYLATSSDGKTFSEPALVAFGGAAGAGASDAECPFVVKRDDGFFYLFRTSQVGISCDYCPGDATYVYASTDPTDFGVDDDSKLVTTLPLAGPEVHTVDGKDYLAHVLPSLKGIEVCDLSWTQ